MDKSLKKINSWKSANEPVLNQNFTDIWLLDFTSIDEDLYLHFLSPDELKKADKFHFIKDRQAYTICRGVLRKLLSSYVGITPSNIEFTYNEYGKPEISNETKINFNVSHSGDYGLLAFSSLWQLGVDLEKIKSIEYMSLAESVFSDEEFLSLRDFSSNDIADAFFCGWTRKESFIKAIGMGLSYPLSDFCVSLDPNEDISKVKISDPALENKNWTIFDLTFNTDYKAALAIDENIKDEPNKYIYSVRP